MKIEDSFICSLKDHKGSDTVCSMIYHGIQTHDFRGARNIIFWSESRTDKLRPKLF